MYKATNVPDSSALGSARMSSPRKKAPGTTGKYVLRLLVAAGILLLYFEFVFGAKWYRDFVLKFVNEWALFLIGGVGLALILVETLIPSSWRVRAREILTVSCFAGAIIAFTIPLAQSWSVGHPLDKDGQMWAGLIPIADNYYYWAGLHQLKAGHELGVIGSRRPLNAAYFTLRHVISGGSLQRDLILQAALLGMACFFAAREFSFVFCRIAGLLSFLVLYDYSITWIPSTMTESFGLTLGAGAFAFIVRGWAQRKLALFVLGIVLLSVGQGVRGGAFFVLPLIAVAGTIRLADRMKERARCLSITAAAIVVGFLPAWILYQQYGDKTSGHLNGGGLDAYLYGMSMGGTGFWSGIDYLNAHGFGSRSEKEKDEILLDQTVANIRAHPARLVHGIGHEYLRYLRAYSPPLGSWRVFTALAGLSGPATEALCSILFVIGIIFCVLRRLWSLLAFLTACWLGITLSVPLLAEMERRLFAVTVPATAFLAAAGLSLAIDAIFRGHPPYLENTPIQPLSQTEKLACWIVASLLLVTTLTPTIVLFVYRPKFPQLACADGLSPRIVRTVSGSSFVFLHGDGELAKSSVPDVRESDYRGNFKLPYFAGLPPFMRELRPGQFLSAEMTWLPLCCIDSWKFYVGEQTMISEGEKWSYWCVENKGDYNIVRYKAHVVSP
jgi:hypothetical protein